MQSINLNCPNANFELAMFTSEPQTLCKKCYKPRQSGTLQGVHDDIILHAEYRDI